MRDEYRAYCVTRAAYYPERAELTEAEYRDWCALYEQHYARAWEQTPPDWATITLLETQLCL